jgi:RNA polymerase sigma-70 factor (ECF subfamily)
MGNGTPDEDALMRAAQAGDQRAFDALASSLRPVVAARVRGIVRDPHAADDILQETLLRAWTRSDSWNGSGSVRQWALGIAAHLALNHLRATRRRAETAIGDHEAHTPGPDSRALQAEDARRLRGLIGSLSPAKRQVVTMACEDDLSVREVAERLGIPEGTVKSRLHHARQWLTKQWELRDNEGKDSL